MLKRALGIILTVVGLNCWGKDIPPVALDLGDQLKNISIEFGESKKEITVNFAPVYSNNSHRVGVAFKAPYDGKKDDQSLVDKDGLSNAIRVNFKYSYWPERKGATREDVELACHVAAANHNRDRMNRALKILKFSKCSNARECVFERQDFEDLDRKIGLLQEDYAKSKRDYQALVDSLLEADTDAARKQASESAKRKKEHFEEIDNELNAIIKEEKRVNDRPWACDPAALPEDKQFLARKDTDDSTWYAGASIEYGSEDFDTTSLAGITASTDLSDIESSNQTEEPYILSIGLGYIFDDVHIFGSYSDIHLNVAVEKVRKYEVPSVQTVCVADNPSSGLSTCIDGIFGPVSESKEYIANTSIRFFYRPLKLGFSPKFAHNRDTNVNSITIPVFYTGGHDSLSVGLSYNWDNMDKDSNLTFLIGVGFKMFD